MIIENVIIEDKVKEKILEKHNVTSFEIENVLLGNPLVLKTKESRHLAVGFYHRYLTIVFEYGKKTANIITAYPSSEWQIKLFKEKRR
ncbi:MAG: hypothetical protein HYW24_03480 [Candidatus Aenigmarchaeota archaeon]|nr:hypothetical protein [Candidatus Aenigmarchaeota archaeon]